MHVGTPHTLLCPSINILGAGHPQQQSHCSWTGKTTHRPVSFPLSALQKLLSLFQKFPIIIHQRNQNLCRHAAFPILPFPRYATITHAITHQYTFWYANDHLRGSDKKFHKHAFITYRYCINMFAITSTYLKAEVTPAHTMAYGYHILV